MSKPKIYLRDKIYVPTSTLPSRRAAKEAYTRLLYDDRACSKCEYKEDRHSHVCDVCQNYKGTVKTYNTRLISGVPHIGFPIGDKKKLEYKVGISFEDYIIRDKRTAVPLDYPVKFIIKLRPEQEKLVADFDRHKYGIISAPPRTGKTVLMVYLAIKLGYKAVLLADQKEFLDQFIMHLYGNETADVPCCTNLASLERKVGHKLAGTPKTDEDFENFQFFTMTYQQYLSETKGKDRLRKINQAVGLLMVDEVHSASADCFSRVVNSFYTKYRFGVTGTVERKDGRHFVIKQVVGPVTAKTTIETLTPRVYIRESGIAYRNPPKHPTYQVQRLAKEKKRNAMIVKWAMYDLKHGHSIVIPLTFKKHILELVEAINDAYGKRIAAYFMGGTTAKGKRDREQVLEDARSGKIRVVVGIRRLLQRGINVKPWSAIYEVIPINNEPNFKQESRRVCTPMEGKKQPIIRMLYDNGIGLSIGCAKGTLRHMTKFKYEISDDDKTQACVEELRYKGRGGDDPVDCEDDRTANRKYQRGAAKRKAERQPLMASLFD